jgi:hypothetical protein
LTRRQPVRRLFFGMPGRVVKTAGMGMTPTRLASCAPRLMRCRGAHRRTPGDVLRRALGFTIALNSDFRHPSAIGKVAVDQPPPMSRRGMSCGGGCAIPSIWRKRGSGSSRPKPDCPEAAPKKCLSPPGPAAGRLIAEKLEIWLDTRARGPSDRRAADIEPAPAAKPHRPGSGNDKLTVVERDKLASQMTRTSRFCARPGL